MSETPEMDRQAVHYQSTHRYPRDPEICYCVPVGTPRYVGTARIDGALCYAWRGTAHVHRRDGSHRLAIRYFFETAR